MKDPVSHDHIEFEACRRLWITVLLSALHHHRKDIEKEAQKYGRKPAQSRARERAVNYVRSRDCQIVALRAGFELKVEQVIRWLDGEGPAPRWSRKDAEE